MLLNDKEFTVDIKIKGQRRNIMGINKSDITIMADVNDIDSTGTHRVYPKVVMPYGNVDLVDNPQAISVVVDEVVTEKKEVRVLASGNPRGGYVVGDIKYDLKTVTVKGAKSIISGVDYVAAEVDVSGKTEDISSIEPLYLVGSSDKIASHHVTIDKESVDVHCEILKKKTVDIKVIFADGVNSKKEWYVLDANSVKTVELAGTAAAMEAIDAAETKTVTKYMIKESGEVVVELSLPEGVKSLDGNTVTLKLRKETKEE